MGWENPGSTRAAVLGLDLKHFRYAGSDTDALRRIRLVLAPGSLTAIVGSSGSGKSTLGLVLAGMLPRPGTDTLVARVTLAGQEIEFGPANTPRIDPGPWAHHIGLLPQEAAHYLSGIRETVAEELAFSLENAGTARPEMERRVSRIVQRFSLGHLLQRDPARLSGGQQRLVALAALAVNEPSIVVLDEPLAGLDAAAAARVVEFINQLRAAGTALVVLARSEDVLTERADEVLQLAQGQLYTVESLKRSNRGSGVAPRRDPLANQAKTVLDFTGVRLRYPGAEVPVVDGLDLRVRAGECVALSGANGTGKSTVLKAAAGLLKPNTGSIQRNAETGLLLQNPSDQLFERTVRREVGFGLPKRGRQSGLVDEVLGRLGLLAFAEVHPYELPASLRRLVALATVLVRDPMVLLLDEPTEALDEAGLRRLHEVIDSLLERGRSVLLSTHDQQFMRAVAHRVHRMEASPPGKHPAAR